MISCNITRHNKRTRTRFELYEFLRVIQIPNMNIPPIPKPRALAPKSSINDGLKKPIPLPRVRPRKLPSSDEDSQNGPIYGNASVSSSSTPSSLDEDCTVNSLDVNDENYYATILEKPDAPVASSPNEKRDRAWNGRDLIKTFSSDLQERRRSVVGSLEKGKKSARDRIERSTKHAKEQLSRVQKRFTSFGRETNTGTVYSIPPSFEESVRPSSVPVFNFTDEATQTDKPLNPVLSSKRDDLTKIRDSFDSTRGYSPPPPEYPPPPLPDDSTYDVPSSACSSRFNTLSTAESSSSSYRSSFSGVASLYDEPRSSRNITAPPSDTLSLSNRSDPEAEDISDTDELNDFSTLARGKHTMRANSWSFYDSVSKRSSVPSTPEPVYSNDVNEQVSDAIYSNDTVDSTSVAGANNEPLTPTVVGNDRFSDISHLSENSLYENCEITLPTKLREPAAGSRLKHCDSLLREFDPLAVAAAGEPSTPAENELLLLESLLEGDTYGTLGRNQQPIRNSQEDVEEIEEDYPDSDEDNTNVVYGLATVSEETNAPKSAVIKVTNVLHEPAPELPQKIKNRDNDLSKPSSSTSNPTFPLAPKINLSAAQYESLADSLSDSSGLLHGNSELMLNRTNSEEKEEKVGVGKNFVRLSSALWRKASFRTKDAAKAADSVTRPPLNGMHVSHKGKLYKCSDIFFNAKQDNFQARWCKIEEGKLLCHSDAAMTLVKETIAIDNLMSVQIVHNHKLSLDGNDLHCFELNMQTNKTRLDYLFALNTSIERNQWAQKLLEVMTNFFPAKHMVDFTRAGWCFLKNGISCKWASTWILLRHRSLIYQCPYENTLQTVDLRKARCIVLQDPDESCNDMICEGGSVALVDSPQYCLYLRMGTPRETKIWRHEIQTAATRNGPALHQQQLTKDNIPTLVDKCLNFIYTHGSLSEGIYRRSGSSVAMNKLLTAFRVDAWQVQLTTTEFSEHDVAGTLKRFFRDLPEPLLTVKLSPYFLKSSAKKELPEKIKSYKRYMTMLPMINAATLKKLLGHLHFIQSQQATNLMNVDNLSAIWGPTLLQGQNAALSGYAVVEYNVIVDLITMYKQLYELSDDELKKEKLMLTVLKRYHSATNSMAPTKPSGDIRMWVQLDNATKDCIPVAISPQMTANDLCHIMSSKMGMNGHELIVEENILQGQLKRPIHFNESILQTVLRWGYWNDEDRKDNILVVRKDNFFRDVAPYSCAPCTMSGELKFADNKTKNFKLQTFDFSQAKLSYYKDKSGATRVCEWKIEDIVWYLGYESKRNPQSLWSVTFVPKINKPKRSKDAPYFGCTFAGTNSRDMLRWLGVMLCSEYPRGVLAPARLVLD